MEIDGKGLEEAIRLQIDRLAEKGKHVTGSTMLIGAYEDYQIFVSITNEIGQKYDNIDNLKLPIRSKVGGK